MQIKQVMGLGRALPPRLSFRTVQQNCTVMMNPPIRSFNLGSVLYDPSSRLRNIGIMAHIDAGKTTTTERMLFYSGYTKRLGEVHTGDTVMDYMDQERDRGITITAAAITLPWNKHQINVIDTPGHVDFTMEVERSLRVTDGGILILDGSVGVQAQTLTVWKQAKRNNVNTIAYINKLDKPNSSVDDTLLSMETKLNVKPLLTQMLLGHGKDLYGLVDLVDMAGYVWDKSSQGKSFKMITQDEVKNTMFTAWKEAIQLRELLIEQCCDFDDEIAENVLVNEGYDEIDAGLLRDGLRRITLNCESGAVVTCLGSSYKNVGVQPLMDAVTQYLPSPSDKYHTFLRYYGSNLCGLVFKIIHHPQKGVLTFVRVYSGTLTPNCTLYNVNKQQSERCGKLMVAFADDFREVGEIGAGNIAVISGLKLSITGDTIVQSPAVAKSALQKLRETEGEEADVGRTTLASPVVPEPVFFCSIEPPSIASQKQLDLALECLVREDPSLTVRTDDDTGQTVLGGMGELHLEIILNRIHTGWKVDADIGKLQVAYREVPCVEQSCSQTFERRLGDRNHVISLDLVLKPVPAEGGATVNWSKDKSAMESIAKIKPQTRKIVEDGIKSGLSGGPLLGYPLVDCSITIQSIQIGRNTSAPMISAGAASITKSLVNTVDVRLAEPMMAVEIVCEDDVVTDVFQDLQRRRGEVDYRQDRSGTGHLTGMSVVRGNVPLSQLRGYSSHLRTFTSGRANLSMQLSHYQLMSEYDQNVAIEDVTGFAVS